MSVFLDAVEGKLAHGCGDALAQAPMVQLLIGRGIELDALCEAREQADLGDRPLPALLNHALDATWQSVFGGDPISSAYVQPQN